MKFLVLCFVAALATVGNGQSYSYYTTGGSRQISGLSGLSGGLYGGGLYGGNYRLVSGGLGNVYRTGYTTGLSGYQGGLVGLAAAPAATTAYLVQGAAPAASYSYQAAAPATVAYQTVQAAPAAAVAVAPAAASLQTVAYQAAAPAASLSVSAANLQAANTAPVHAAITTTRNVEVVEGPSSEGLGAAQSVVIGPNTQPLNLEFHSQASPLSVNQIHHPTPAAAPQESRHEEEADILRQEIVKPVVQEVHETIQPFRRVTQELKPVEEHVTQVLTRGQERHLYTAAGSSGSQTAAPLAVSSSVLASHTGAALQAGAGAGAGAGGALLVSGGGAARGASIGYGVSGSYGVPVSVAVAQPAASVAVAQPVSVALVGQRVATAAQPVAILAGGAGHGYRLGGASYGGAYGLRAGGAQYRLVGGLQNIGGLQNLGGQSGSYSYRTASRYVSGTQQH